MTETPFPIDHVRKQFPALSQIVNQQNPIYFDGPGGSQIVESAIDAVQDYMHKYMSNVIPGDFFAAQKTADILQKAREDCAAFVNAGSASEIVFGANMTSLTLHISRSIANEWETGDEIIVTALDHYANVSPWMTLAAEKGVIVHQVGINTDDCTLDIEHLDRVISDKTKLVAVTLASNITGTIVDVRSIVQKAKAVGALTYIDAVHFAPHILPNVQNLECDFLACSNYKFFGPHIGFLYAKQEHLQRLSPYKVAPAPSMPPASYETGTQNFASISGLSASIHYLASLGNGDSLRDQLISAYDEISAYEQSLTEFFFNHALDIKDLKIYGITDPRKLSERTSTFAMTIDGHHPKTLSDHLAKHNIAAWAGHFYAVGVTDALGLTDQGGVLRVGCMHYNTIEELERFFTVIKQIL